MPGVCGGDIIRILRIDADPDWGGGLEQGDKLLKGSPEECGALVVDVLILSSEEVADPAVLPPAEEIEEGRVDVYRRYLLIDRSWVKFVERSARL